MRRRSFGGLGALVIATGAALGAAGAAWWILGSVAAAAASGGVVLLLAVGLELLLARGGRAPEDGLETETEPIWPYVAGREELGRGEARDGHESAWAIAVIGLTLGLGGLAFAVFALRQDDEGGPASAEPTETAVPTATERQSSTPTLTPTSEATATATPSPTPPPPTRAPTERPTEPPTRTPVPPRQQIAADLNGTWEIVDVVESGPDAGASYRFVVNLSQEGTSLQGSGDGLEIEGRVEGAMLLASYTRPGGSGVFTWRLSPGSDSFEGEFQDFGAQNSGRSVLTRLP